jgi:hypothetical protein
MAIKRDPRIPNAYLFRGNALLALGKDGDAEKDFEHAISIQPQLRSNIEEGIKMIKSQRK